jgi:hypothetical protein
MIDKALPDYAREEADALKHVERHPLQYTETKKEALQRDYEEDQHA